MANIQEISEIFSSLAEPNRLHIIELLKGGPMSVSEVESRFNLSQPQISKHLKSLKESGLLKQEQFKQKRIYSLEKKNFNELEEWLNSYKKIWENKFDNLDKLLTKEKAKLKNE